MLENDVIKIMDDLNVEKANFVGLSMGGMTSLGLALKHQNRFNKFIAAQLELICHHRYKKDGIKEFL